MGKDLNHFDLSGKTALVTGAYGGIGGVVCEKLIEHGAQLIVSGRTEKKLVKLSEDLNCDYVVADLALSADIKRLAKSALEISSINILIHVAGLVHPGPAVAKKESEWDDTIDVNLKAPFLLSQAIAPSMIENGGGKIVMIGSTGGMRGLPDRVAYASSKGGMNMLTKQLAVEWGPHNLQVNLVAPTVVMTPMAVIGWADPERKAKMLSKIPAGRFPEPIDVANAVVFLSSAASDMVNGVILPVDGGLMA